MDPSAPDLDELLQCSCCKQAFNETDQSPKLLSCKHYFCLQCTRTSLNKGSELYCIHCWKRTEITEMGPENLQTYTPIVSLMKKLNPKLTKTPEKKVISENCHTHAMPLALWCHTCTCSICRACATTNEHVNHQIKTQNEAKDQLACELHSDLDSMDHLLKDTQKFHKQQKEFLLKILEACISLKQYLENELLNNISHLEFAEIYETISKIRMNLLTADTPNEIHNLYNSFTVEKHRLQMRYHDMYLQNQWDDLIKNANVLLDVQLLKQNFGGDLFNNSRYIPPPNNPHLILANYCIIQMYNRPKMAPQNNGEYFIPNNNYALIPKNMYDNVNANHNANVNAIPQANSLNLNMNSLHLNNNLNSNSYASNFNVSLGSPQMVRNPVSICPLYFFNIEVNGAPHGRIVIEVRADVAPKMAKNFGVLTTGESGLCYKGCSIFQCWEGESVITGDFELNNGRGGRSVYEESFFLPDDTKLLAVRGTVGMRRTQKRHDNMGMVGSQFRIILQEMRGFSGIFGHVVEGLELVEKISTYGDTTGKPTKNILISKCGKL